MVNIEICGDYVAVALSYEDDDGDRVRLFVINWKSGFKFSVSEFSKLLLAGHSWLCYPQEIAHPDSPGVVFLTEQLLMNPSVARGSLDVYYLTPMLDENSLSQSTLTLPRIYSLLLPTSGDGKAFIELDAQCSPNTLDNSSTHSTSRQSTRAFLSDPSKAIISLIVVMDVDTNGSWLSDFEIETFHMAVHRQSMVDLIPLDLLRSTEAEHVVPEVAWSDWGPPITRWFLIPDNVAGPPFSVEGQRWVQQCLPRPFPESATQPERIAGLSNIPRPHNTLIGYLYNFNPWTVKLLEQHSTGTLSPVVSRFHSPNPPTSKQQQFPSSSSPTLVLPKEDTAALYLDPPKDVFNSLGAFCEEIIGGLPYVRFEIRGDPDMDQMLLDDRRIVLLKVCGASLELDISFLTLRVSSTVQRFSNN